MEKLLKEQIDAIVEWMNNWEQLQGTAIPIRFEEDWSKQINFSDLPTPSLKKPPIGLIPKFIHVQKRQKEIMAAISRYLDAGINPPKEWADEFASYCDQNFS